MKAPLAPSAIDATLREIAARQLGLLTVEQAAAAGVDRYAIRRRRQTGALALVFPGVHRLAAAAVTGEQRALAASLAVPGSVVAAISAARIYGLPLPASLEGEVLTVGPERSVRITGITAIRQSITLPTRRWWTTRIATPAATLLLLPRYLDDDAVERCLDHCITRRLTQVRTVRALVDAVPSHAVRGRPLLMELLTARRSGIGHRSGLEQRVDRWLRNAGLRGFARNLVVDVGNGQTVEVDFGWLLARVSLEVSPFVTHGSRAAQERDAERRRVLVACGWLVIEATDADLASERAFGRIVELLRRLLSERLRALGATQRSLSA